MSDDQDRLPPFEHRKWAYELARRDAERAHDSADAAQKQLADAAVRSADVALRTAVLINGGAAVAMLAFIGGLISSEDLNVGQLKELAGSLVWFAWGVACAVAGLALSYSTTYAASVVVGSQEKGWEHPFVQPGPKTKRWRFVENTCHLLAVLVGVASLALFVWGMLDVRDSVWRLAAPAASAGPSPQG
jgi:hypothetical protein